jgi:hypothetical protein
MTHRMRNRRPSISASDTKSSDHLWPGSCGRSTLLISKPSRENRTTSVAHVGVVGSSQIKHIVHNGPPFSFLVAAEWLLARAA